MMQDNLCTSAKVVILIRYVPWGCMLGQERDGDILWDNRWEEGLILSKHNPRKEHRGVSKQRKNKNIYNNIYIIIIQNRKGNNGLTIIRIRIISRFGIRGLRIGHVRLHGWWSRIRRRFGRWTGSRIRRRPFGGERSRRGHGNRIGRGCMW